MAYRAQLVVRTSNPIHAKTIDRIKELADDSSQTISDIALDGAHNVGAVRLWREAERGTTLRAPGADADGRWLDVFVGAGSLSPGDRDFDRAIERSAEGSEI